MTSLRTLFWSASALTVASTIAVAAAASALTLPSYSAGGKSYFVVKANDPSMNTGKKVCAAVGRSCIGYTSTSTDACKYFHPTAKTLRSVNGSKSGFFCDGAPQKGLACENVKNTCEVCPSCNVNLTCDTDLTSMNQFREAYVECGAPVASTSTSSKAYGVPPLPSNSSSSTSSDLYPKKQVCEFYQPTSPNAKVVSNKKQVSCKAYRAADTFCMLSMGSRLAKAEKCEDNGQIVCSIPCGITLARCSADINRPRGVNAPPIVSCPSKASSSTSQKKKAGETCNHGGDCITGICLGTGRPFNQNLYQCSCSQTRLDASCNK